MAFCHESPGIARSAETPIAWRPDTLANAAQDLANQKDATEDGRPDVLQGCHIQSRLTGVGVAEVLAAPLLSLCIRSEALQSSSFQRHRLGRKDLVPGTIPPRSLEERQASPLHCA